MKRLIALATALGAGLIATGLPSSYGSTVPSSAHAGGATVALAKSPLGRILVDGKGRTLYDFPPDKHGMSTCYSACAALWPPLTTHGRPVAGHGVRASLLGTTKRKDGKLQVTYEGHPLYYFAPDKQAGDINGQGIKHFGGTWWVVSSAGAKITSKP